jgi:hypothetical protein
MADRKTRASTGENLVDRRPTLKADRARRIVGSGRMNSQ